MKVEDLDHTMDVLNSLEEKERGRSGKQAQGRMLIGEVDHFFDKINVAAIRLQERLEVGDTIEVECEEYTLRQKVSSMQINRKDVSSATAGEDVGVRLSVPVPRGSSVYKIGGQPS